ncbi:MAG: energy transducer TonB [Candidatus Methylomirabilales bacterium]
MSQILLPWVFSLLLFGLCAVLPFPVHCQEAVEVGQQDRPGGEPSRESLPGEGEPPRAGGLGGPPGRASGAGIGWVEGFGLGGETDVDWREFLRQRIERAKRYPALARRWGMEGTAEVEFRIARDGSVERITVVRSSGFPLLDEASVKTVKRAAPLPFIPGTIRIPISYRLRDRQ